jgi:hypothetical protein
LYSFFNRSGLFPTARYSNNYLLNNIVDCLGGLLRILFIAVFLIIISLISAQNSPPEYSFIPNGDGETTTLLLFSLYDYMPYGFNGYNIRKQSAVSNPYGYSAGGFYIGYLGDFYGATCSRAGFSYLYSDMTLFCEGTVGFPYMCVNESVPSVDIDPFTCNPFFTWSAIEEEDLSQDCLMDYDNFHLTGATGYWRQPWILVDNPELGESLTGHNDDEFIRPIIWVGNSPEDGHNRIHVYTGNSSISSNGLMNSNIIYCHADFSADDMLYESEFDWTYRTFPYLDQLSYEEGIRINKDMVVNDQGQVVFFGSFGDSLFCLYSNDCGETFTMFTQEWLYPVENPLQQDGVTYEFYDDDGVTPSELVFCLSNDGTHYNGVFSNDNNKILWMTGINLNSIENKETGCYMAAYFYPKIFSFEIQSGSFDFYDIDITGVDPGDEQPMIPWDLDEDGFVDEYSDDGSVSIPLSMPSWYFNSDPGYQDAFLHENNFKMSANNNWIAAVWHDCRKHRMACLEEPGYEDWFQQPEIAISISDDSGETWSEIRYISANEADSEVDPVNHFEGNFAPEFTGMLPVNVTLGEELEIISNEPDNYHAKLYFAFYDDNDYGSYWGVTGNENTGGHLRFAALDIEFQAPWQEPTSAEDHEFPNKVDLKLTNYPNPFNPSGAGRGPSTVISFQLSENIEPEDVELTIYNIKGQKVEDFSIPFDYAHGDRELTYSATWDGTDFNDNPVSSGIYFARLKAGNRFAVKKMILIK